MKLLTSDYFAWTFDKFTGDPPMQARFMPIFYPLLESFVTPIPNQCLSFGDQPIPSDEIILRDGRFGLCSVFGKLKVGSIKRKFYVDPALLDAIPESWQKRVGCYRLVSHQDPRDCKHAIFVVSLYQFFLNRIYIEQEVAHLAKSFDFERVSVLALHANFHQGIDPVFNITSTLEIFEKHLDVAPKLMSVMDLFNMQDFSDVAYMELLGKNIIGGTFLKNHIFSRGGANLDPYPEASFFKGALEMPLSVNHGLQVAHDPKFPKPLKTSDVRKMAAGWEAMCASLKSH